jgi:small subunit ribosomal protein S4
MDNVIYRLGLATSRAQARQLVRHGHFMVNGRKVDVPSYSLKAGDVITVRGTSAQNAAIQHAIEEVKGRGIPEWLNWSCIRSKFRVSSFQFPAFCPCPGNW